MHYANVIIIGAGAAGLTAAIFAARGLQQDRGMLQNHDTHTGGRGGRAISKDSDTTGVILLERTPQPGRKILMSGGTRCNVLPVEMQLDDFVTDSSRNRMRNVFRSWSVDACRRWFADEIGLQLACEEASNKWFPESNSAREVRDLLVRHATGLGVEIRTGASVASVRRSGPVWVVSTGDGVHYGAPVVVFATGGLSIPSTGTDGTGHSIAESLGHTLHPTYPALTPLKCPHPGREPLPGVSLDVDLEPVFVDAAASGSNASETAAEAAHDGIRPVPKERCPFRTRRSGFLFTHQGCSGPAVLDVSHVIVRAQQSTAALRVNWTGKPAAWWQQQLEGRHTTTSLLRGHLPRRLADNLLEENGLADRKTAQLSAKERQRLIADLTAYLLIPTGHLGYNKAEVTGGGVPLDEIHPATMESRIAPGIFLCGEILDVFGRIGGFNFYWAWVSGRLAGIHAASSAARLATEQ
jgi:predicted flavoprotein YhiN